MSHAAFSGWAAIRTGVCLPSLVIAFAMPPSSCSCRFGVKPSGEFGWDFSDIEVLEAARDGSIALDLNLLERIADFEDAQKLHDFGRDEGSSLAQTRELVDSVIREAEAGLQKKWPQQKLILSLVSASLVAPFYDPDEGKQSDDVDGHIRLDRSYIAESIERLRESYPALAATLPDVEKLKTDAKKAEEAGDSGIAAIDLVAHFRMAYTDERPDGEFKTRKEIELALLRTNPMKATLRLVYEVVAPKGKVNEAIADPVLAVEVVTLRFEYDGEQWKAITEAEPKAEADARRPGDR